jgi:hypothetical protein
MGVVENISADRWPRQGENLGARVEVCFHYDTSKMVSGIILRDDRDEPFRTIIQLDTGRVVLGVECQYTLVMDP